MKSIVKYYKLWSEKWSESNKDNPSKKKSEVLYDFTSEKEDLIKFEKRGLLLITNYMNKSDYNEHRTLIREINFLIGYTFEVLKDDYYKGDIILLNNIPHLDNYVFSTYRKSEKLKNNIEKLITIAFSNRFNPDPRENLLAYYVFLEEVGFEITIFLNDYYNLLISTDGKKKLKTKKTNNCLSENKPSLQDLLIELTNENILLSPLDVQKKIIDDAIKKNKTSLIKD